MNAYGTQELGTARAVAVARGSHVARGLVAHRNQPGSGRGTVDGLSVAIARPGKRSFDRTLRPQARTERPPASATGEDFGAWRRCLRFRHGGLDRQAHRAGHPRAVRHSVSLQVDSSLVARLGLELAEAAEEGQRAQRRGRRALGAMQMAEDKKKPGGWTRR